MCQNINDNISNVTASHNYPVEINQGNQEKNRKGQLNG